MTEPILEFFSICILHLFGRNSVFKCNIYLHLFLYLGQQFNQQNYPNQQQFGGQSFAPGGQAQGNYPQGQAYNQNMGQQQYGQFQGQGQRFPGYNRPQGNMGQGGMSGKPKP